MIINCFEAFRQTDCVHKEIQFNFYSSKWNYREQFHQTMETNKIYKFSCVSYELAKITD